MLIEYVENSGQAAGCQSTGPTSCPDALESLSRAGQVAAYMPWLAHFDSGLATARITVRGSAQAVALA